MVITFGIESEGEVGVEVFLECQLGCSHAADGVGEIGSVPTDALEKVAAAGGDVLVSMPIASLQDECGVFVDGVELECDVWPESGALAEVLLVLGRDVLIQEAGEVEGEAAAVVGHAADAEGEAFVEKRFDAGVKGGELAATMAPQKTEWDGECKLGSAYFGKGKEVAGAQGEALLLGLPGLEEVFPVNPGVAEEGASVNGELEEELYSLFLVVVDVAFAVEHGFVESVGKCTIEAAHDHE